MRIVTTVLVLSCFLLPGPGSDVSAQVRAPIETDQGRSYYQHTVAKGQTLYSISRLYECDINVILAANPGSDQGIREGQVLRLPVEKCGARVEVLVPGGNQGFIEHEVKKRETLYSISRKYQVDIHAIMAANPGSEAGISKGQILRVPVGGGRPEAPAPAKEPSRTHTVAPGETLYGIARIYQLTPDAILKANPGSTEALKPGQVLQLPAADPITTELPSEPVSNAGTFRPIELEGEVTEPSYEIGLMLPFLTQAADTVGLTPKEKKLREVAFQIYRGVQMAADTLKASGLSADIYTYDVADDRNGARTLLAGKEMENMDLVIGPAFRDPLNEVATWAAGRGVHVVCPVPQANKVLLSSPNMSKAYPSEVTLWEMLGKFVARQHARDNVILVRTNDVDDLKRVQVFRSGFLSEAGDSVQEFEVRNRSASGLVKKLRPTGTNVVVVPTSDRLLMTTLFRELSSENTIVYLPSEWEDHSAIEPAVRNQYRIRYPKSVFLDYADPRMQAWVEGYRKRFRSEPGEYSVLGYSMLLYYGEGLRRYGKDFPNHFGEWTCGTCVGTGFGYVRTGHESGFENSHLVVVGTDMFELRPVAGMNGNGK